MKTICNNCNKDIIKHSRNRKWKHHFCNRECYSEYAKNHPETFNNKNRRYDMTHLNKVETFAEIRNQNIYK